MRLSAALKGKDYRDLLEIIDLTYSGSCADALFPPLFEKLARAIGCDSAVYMPMGEAGLPRTKIRGPIVFETSIQLAREYAEYYWEFDPFCITGWTRESNRARVTDLLPASKHANSEFAVDFCARVPACWVGSRLVSGIQTLDHDTGHVASRGQSPNSSETAGGGADRDDWEGQGAVLADQTFD